MEFPDTITLTITEDHARRGEAEECSLCPIALALSESGYYGVRVFPASAWCYARDPFVDSSEDNPPLVYDLDTAALRFINAYDASFAGEFGGEHARITERLARFGIALPYPVTLHRLYPPAPPAPPAPPESEDSRGTT